MPDVQLNRNSILVGAVELADRIGVHGLTMRALADHLGSRPMSLYHHVPNKEAILDGMVDAVFAEIERPGEDEPWRAALTRRYNSTRHVLARHPWAIPLLDSRVNAGPATLHQHDANIGCLRSAGFSLPLIAHTAVILDAFVYGFVLQEQALPISEEGGLAAVATDAIESLAPDELPNLAHFATHHVMQPDYDFADSFAWGLDLLLDAIEGKLLTE